MKIPIPNKCKKRCGVKKTHNRQKDHHVKKVKEIWKKRENIQYRIVDEIKFLFLNENGDNLIVHWTEQYFSSYLWLSVHSSFQINTSSTLLYSNSGLLCLTLLYFCVSCAVHESFSTPSASSSSASSISAQPSIISCRASTVFYIVSPMSSS